MKAIAVTACISTTIADCLPGCAVFHLIGRVESLAKLVVGVLFIAAKLRIQ